MAMHPSWPDRLAVVDHHLKDPFKDWANERTLRYDLLRPGTGYWNGLRL